MAPGACEENRAMLSYHSINILTQNPEKLQDEKCNGSIGDVMNRSMYDDEDDVPRQYTANRRGLLAQCMVAGSVLILTTGVGMPIGYSAILLPQLTVTNGPLHVDQAMGSWIASIHSLATPVGSLLAGPLVDGIGRRGSLQLAALPIFIGWLFIGFSTSIWMMLVGRFAAGLGVGMCSVPAQILVGEIADAGIRGFLVTISMTAYCAGILLVYALGAAFRWETVAFCATILPAISVIALGMVTESPAWLIRREKFNAAKEALMWLRGGDLHQVNLEMSVLKMRAKEDLTQMSLTMSLRERVSDTREKVLHPGVLKPLLIINVFFLLQVLSGTYLIVYYGVDLVQDIGKGGINNYAAAVTTAVIRFLFCFLSCFLLLRMGRRTIAISSALGTALFSLVLAGYIFSRTDDSLVDKYVIGICLLGYIILNTIGLLTLPGMMIGELLPQRARGIGGGCTMFIYHLSMFGATKVFPTVSAAVGMGGVFVIFGVSALLETIFIWLVLPETKNCTLQQIEDYFNNGNMLWIKKRQHQNERLTSES